MKKTLLILTVIGLQAGYCQGYLVDGCSEWNPKENLERLRDNHIQLTIRNGGLDMVRIGYYKIKGASAATTNNECSRRLHLKPGEKATIHLLKNRSFRYQNNVGCPEDCEQIGDHYHWGEKIEVSFKKGQSIVLRATKSASKKS